MLRLAHISDVHFGCENAIAVAATHAWLEQERPDAVLVTGDITQSGRRREFAAAQAWLAGIGAPLLCTPGNHDTPYWDLLARLAWPFRRYAAFIGPEASDGLRLAVEPFLFLVTGIFAEPDHFQGNSAVEASLSRLEDNSHATPAYFVE